MARVYYQPKDPLAGSARPRSRPWWLRGLKPVNRLGCAVYIFLFILLAATAVVAQTGLIRIPVLSTIFFRPLEPTRRITTTADNSKMIGRELTETLTSYSAAGEITIPLGEKELTKLLRLAFVDQAEPVFSEVQSVIEPGGIEIYGKISSAKHPYHFITVLQPKIEKGKLNFTVLRATLERLPIPANFADTLFHNALNNSLSVFNTEAKKYFIIKNIELADREVRLTGRLVQSNLPF